MIGSKRRQPAFALDVANALEVLGQYMLFRRDLRFRGQMLQRTAATIAKMRAARLNSQWRWREHLKCARFVVALFPPATLGKYPLAGQRPADKHRLAVEAPHAATIVTEVGDIDFKLRLQGKRHAVLGSRIVAD